MTVKLLLTPDQDGYTVEDPDSVVATKVDGGPPRYRRDYFDASLKVEVTWTCTPDEYQYLRAFYNYVNKGADPFLLDLLINTPTLQTYVCRFKPGTFKLTSVKGYMFKVKVTLDVQPNDGGVDFASIVEDFVQPPYEAPPPPTDWGVE